MFPAQIPSPHTHVPTPLSLVFSEPLESFEGAASPKDSSVFPKVKDAVPQGCPTLQVRGPHRCPIPACPVLAASSHVAGVSPSCLCGLGSLRAASAPGLASAACPVFPQGQAEPCSGGSEVMETTWWGSLLGHVASTCPSVSATIWSTKPLPPLCS